MRSYAILINWGAFYYLEMVTDNSGTTDLKTLRQIQEDIREIKQMLTHIVETRCDRYYIGPFEPFDAYR